VLGRNVVLGLHQTARVALSCHVTESDIALQRAEERNPVSDEHRHSGDNDALNNARTQESLNREPPVDVKVVGTTSSKLQNMSAGVPAICFTRPPRAADKSTGRLLRTTTCLSPYGQSSKVRTVSKVLRLLRSHRRLP
jgi:hypothetical protein